MKFDAVSICRTQSDTILIILQSGTITAINSATSPVQSDAITVPQAGAKAA